MTRTAFVRAGVAVAGAAIWISIDASPATACNRMAGCVMDVLLEDHGMMQGGRMTAAMREGQENIAVFRRQQAIDQAAGRMPPTSK